MWLSVELPQGIVFYFGKITRFLVSLSVFAATSLIHYKCSVQTQHLSGRHCNYCGVFIWICNTFSCDCDATKSDWNLGKSWRLASRMHQGVFSIWQTVDMILVIWQKQKKLVCRKHTRSFHQQNLNCLPFKPHNI